jgi:DNA-binding response OmpR family regulator
MAEELDRVLGSGALLAKRSARTQILVVEDDPSAAAMLRELLESSGYHVWVASSGAQAKAMVDEMRPDLVILDLMLPDMDGLVLCSELRSQAQRDIPIIVCSGTSRRRDAILALRLGADDFVQKPFDIYDLEARIEAVLRRSHQQAVQQAAEPDHFRVGDLVIDRSRRHVTLGDEELQLTPTEYRLLHTLASRPDEVFSRDELAQRVWGYRDASSGRAIDVHIRRLRVKLDSAATAPPPIISVRGFGYKLVSSHTEQRGVPSVA